MGCGHYEASHAQDGSECFWLLEGLRPAQERLCKCRRYKMGAAELPKPAAPEPRRERRQSSTRLVSAVGATT